MAYYYRNTSGTFTDLTLNGNIDMNANYLNFTGSASPDYQVEDNNGWKDILGSPVVRGSGSFDPDFANPSFWDSTMRFYEFVGNGPSRREIWFNFHLPHDMADGTTFYIHTHFFAPDVSGGSGNVRWIYNYYHANAMGAPSSEDIFNTSADIANSTTTVDTANKHYISETAELTLSRAGVDGFICVRLVRDPADASDTFGDDVYLIGCDVHYNTNKLTTKNKAYPFYS